MFIYYTIVCMYNFMYLIMIIIYYLFTILGIYKIYIYINVTLDHKTSHEGTFFEIVIYT